MPSPLLWFQFPVSLFLFLLPSVFPHLTPPFSSFSSSSRLSGYIFFVCSSVRLSLSVLILPSHSAARRPQTASERAAQTRIKRKSSAVFCLILPSPYLASSSSCSPPHTFPPSLSRLFLSLFTSSSSSSSSTQTISQSFNSFVSFSTHSLKCFLSHHVPLLIFPPPFWFLASSSSLLLLCTTLFSSVHEERKGGEKRWKEEGKKDCEKEVRKKWKQRESKERWSKVKKEWREVGNKEGWKKREKRGKEPTGSSTSLQTVKWL